MQQLAIVGLTTFPLICVVVFRTDTPTGGLSCLESLHFELWWMALFFLQLIQAICELRAHTPPNTHFSEFQNRLQWINQSKPVRRRRLRGTSIDASAAMGAHRRLSSATRSTDDIDWPVHSLMFSFHDLRGLPVRRLPSTEPCSTLCSSAAYHGDIYDRTMITCGAWRLTVEAHEVRLWYRPAANVFVWCCLYNMPSVLL